jgi:hypothetical protein
MTSSDKNTAGWLVAFAAAHWWGDQLRDLVGLDRNAYPATQGTTPPTNAPAGDTALRSYDLTEGRIRRFEEELAEAIVARLERFASEVVELNI